MFRSNLKRAVFGGLVVLALLAVAHQADAGWWWGSSCCRPVAYYGCYDPCVSWDCCYSGSYYLGVRPGPVRRLLLGRYRWYGTGYGCCYPTYSCGYTSVCGYDACCGTTVYSGGVVADGCGCGGGVVVSPAMPTAESPLPTPAQRPMTAPSTESAAPTPAPEAPATTESPAAPAAAGGAAPTEPGLAPLDPMLPATPAVDPLLDSPAVPAVPGGGLLPGGGTMGPTAAESGLLTVWVPADAKVTINGLATKSTGSRRQFVSYGLRPGFSYKYEVKAEVVRDGRVLEDNRSIVLTAGENTAVAFGFNPEPAQGLAAR